MALVEMVPTGLAPSSFCGFLAEVQMRKVGKVQAKAEPAPEAAPARPGVYGGLALVAMATLLAELTLTRVFSVVLWYHFAFVAVSIALFGMTVGAVIVHLLPRQHKADHPAELLATASALFGLSMALATWLMLVKPWRPPAPGSSLWDLASLYLLLAVPFTFSGIAVSLALTGNARQVNRLYAADLGGAAVGCLVMAGAVRWLGGPGTLVAAGVLAALAGVMFGWRCWLPSRLLALVALVAMVGLLVGGASGRWFELRYTKGAKVVKRDYDAWNAFSRIYVRSLPMDRPGEWGGSLGNLKGVKVNQKLLDIDACAATALTEFDGKHLESVSFFRQDISALVHRLRPGGKVLVIGVGGGRDVLISLVSGQKAVVGVELNDLVLYALNRKFGDFTGHLDRRPDVRMVNDEARSYISRSRERYDVIACSLIDTWAATAAGAFVFSENGLYTTQAWRTFLDHLNDRGVLAVTRWYYARQPSEVLRLLTLAREVLTRYYGVQDVSTHVIVAKRVPPGKFGWGVGTVLVSRQPFTDADREAAQAFCQAYDFDLMVAPGLCRNPDMAAILINPQLEELLARLPLDLSPPTDDRPFFFHMLKPGSPPQLAEFDRGPMQLNLEAVRLLGSLLQYTALLTLVFVALPLALGSIGKQYRYRGLLALLGFFIAIGLGFMMVEISQMQRLMIFLGHPIYGVAVVLFSLLLASGVGSFCSKPVSERIGPGRVMLLLLAALVLFALLTPALTGAGRAWPTPSRLALAIGMLLPMGFLMGMPFPMGMTAANRNPQAPLAWYWGVNGATSVLASVAAMTFSLYWGITFTYLLGVGCYLLAAICLVRAARLKY